MAQEENYIAIVSERHSKPGDTRYIIINRQTREVMDDCGGHGYKSAASAHKSFAFKQRRRSGTAGRQGAKTVTIDAQTGVTKVNTWSGYARRGSSGKQQPSASPKTSQRPAEPTLRFSAPPRQTSSPVGLVSPFVQEEMAPSGQPPQQTVQRQSVPAPIGNGNRTNQRTATDRHPASLISRFSPRQWTCQEDTPRPPELFDSNK